MRPRRRDAAPLQPQARPSCRLQVDAVAAPVAVLERRAAVRGSAQQKSDAYRCPPMRARRRMAGITIAPVQGARVSQRVFSLRDVITSASLRKRRGDTLVSLCESRFPLPRAVPAVCQLAACDAGLLRGDVGRAARKKMVCHGRAIVAVEKSIEAAGARSDARRRVRSRGARRAEGRTELRHVRRRPALNRTSDRRDRRGACVGPTTTQDQPAPLPQHDQARGHH